MRRVLLSFLLLGFVLWIMPLGVFIKPSAEKLACDGQRAICMCHALIPKSTDKAMEAGLSFKSGSSANKESSSGVGSSFVLAKTVVLLNPPVSSLFENQYLFYINPILAAPDCVPKV